MSYLDNIRTFVRVYELGSMTGHGRGSLAQDDHA